MFVFLTLGFAFGELPRGYPSVPITGIDGALLDMPLIGLGTWQYNDSVAEAALLSALQHGYRHVDTANNYKNQAGVGNALAKSGLKRTEFFVTTKVPGNLNASATEQALDQDLKLLQLDYVDLMLIHWPGSDPVTRRGQWETLEKWAQGTGEGKKARAIGISHYCRTHVEEIFSFSPNAKIAVNQNQYHVGMGTDTQKRLHDKAYMESKGILFEAYSSLCGPCDPPDNTALISGPLVTSIGKKYNKTGAQVALRWIVQQGIPVIPKASDSQYQADNFNLFDFYLSGVDMLSLSSATTPAETGTAQEPDDAQDCDFEPDFLF